MKQSEQLGESQIAGFFEYLLIANTIASFLVSFFFLIKAS